MPLEVAEESRYTVVSRSREDCRVIDTGGNRGELLVSRSREDSRVVATR